MRGRIRLADLTPGDTARIALHGGTPETRHRLLEMGLTRGTLVRLVRFAPLGDPVELHVRGYRLSIRRAEAATVAVESCR